MVINLILVEHDKIFSSQLHIKFGLIKNVVRKSNFYRPQFNLLVRETDFKEVLGDIEHTTWSTFKATTQQFLAN